jgi:hypothetical protein
MSEAQDPRQEVPAVENRSFLDLLKSMMGQAVTVVNPESYEHAPVGYTIKPGFYRAKLSGLGQDYLVLLTEHKKSGKEAGKEVVKQFLPFHRIKRVSITKSERFLHL